MIPNSPNLTLTTTSALTASPPIIYIPEIQMVTTVPPGGQPPFTAGPDIAEASLTQPTSEQPNSTPPSATHTSTVSADTVTITVTLPASVVATGQEFNITVTPKSQRTTYYDDSRGVYPITPMNSPVPRLNLGTIPSHSHNDINIRDIGDPFADHTVHNALADQVVRSDTANKGGNNSATNSAALARGSHAVRIIDLDDDSDADDYPVPVYPPDLAQGSVPGVKRGAKFYVITKGKKLGVFYDQWARIEPMITRDGGVWSKQPSFQAAKDLWDGTGSKNKVVMF